MATLEKWADQVFHHLGMTTFEALRLREAAWTNFIVLD